MKNNNTIAANKPIPVCCYARYSSHNQHESSIEAQLSEIYKYAERNNMNIVATYIDRARTGKNDNRPEFKKMMNDAKNAPPWNKVLTFTLNRFSRNKLISHTCYEHLRDLGIELISVTQHFDDSPEGELARSITIATDQHSSAINARHTFSVLKNRASQGRSCGGTPPLGYDFDAFDNLVINEYEAVIVKDIFNMYELDYSYQQIADALNAKGYRTKRGTLFNKNSFNSILTQEKYNGIFTWNKTVSRNSYAMRNSHKQKPIEQQVIEPGKCPRIIDKAQFERVQLKMKDRAEKRASTTRTHYMLSGIKKLRCKECGKFLIGEVKYSHGRKYTVYYCPGHKAGTCSTKPIKTEGLDKMVSGLIAQDLRKRTDLKEISKHMNVNQEYKAWKNRIAGVDKEIKNLLAFIKRGCAAEEIYAELNALSEQKKAYEREAAKYASCARSITEDNQKELCKKLATYLMTSNDYEAKLYLQEVLHSIEVDNNDVTITLNIA